MKKKKTLGLMMLGTLVVAMVITGGCGTVFSATTMRILRYAGEVTLEHNEKPRELQENMKLFSGDRLNTGDGSQAGVGLDDHKIVTLDENSTASFSQTGKQLLLSLEEGGVFFNVTTPLEEDESFDIRTSTMTVGIRGTSGYVNTDSEEGETLIVTDGKVKVVCTNPESGEHERVTVKAGEKLRVVLDGDTVNPVIEPIYGGDLPEFVRDLILRDEELLERVLDDNDWPDLDQMQSAPEGQEAEEGATPDSVITGYFASDDQQGLLAYAMRPDLDEVLTNAVPAYGIMEEQYYVHENWVPAKIYYFGEDQEFAREGDIYILAIGCDSAGKDSRVVIMLKGEANSGNGAIGYSYEAGYISSDYSDKYIVVDYSTGTILEYYGGDDGAGARNEIRRFFPGDLYSDADTDFPTNLYDDLTDLFSADDEMGFKGLLLDRTEDNSILNQMVLFSLDGCPVYGEDADESADYFSKIYVMGDGLNSLKTGDILIEFSNIKNLAGHNSQSVSVIQVLDPTAFSVYETDDTDDGSHYRALEISSSSAYKMFQTFDMSMSAFLTEKYYYRYYSGGQFVTYDYDTDEISVQGTFEDTQYIVF